MVSIEFPSYEPARSHRPSKSGTVLKRIPMSFGIPQGLISLSRAYRFTAMVFYANVADVAIYVAISMA
jgi:hypothetical protein